MAHIGLWAQSDPVLDRAYLIQAELHRWPPLARPLYNLNLAAYMRSEMRKAHQVRSTDWAGHRTGQTDQSQRDARQFLISGGAKMIRM